MIKDDPQIKNILAACHRSTKVTAKVLFPDLFYTNFSVVHDQIFDIIDSGSKKIAIAAPRGIGKTTVASTVASKSILFRDTNFINYVSNSSTNAELQTENIKRELLSNSDIRDLFGNIKSDIHEDVVLDETFSKKAWVAFGNTLVLPRGAGQQVRGLKWKNHRPQLIIIDDLEDKEELMNENNRIKMKEWFFSDLMKSVNRYLNDWRFIYIDTLKHEDSLLQLLLDSSDWDSITLSLCDDSYNSFVPEYITTEELKEEVEQHREKGILDVFYMEYMNVPISREDATFDSKNFKYYDDADIAGKSNIESVVILDPAKTVKIQSSESAIVGIGIDLSSARIYIRDIVSEKMYPDEIYQELFDMGVRLNAKVLGIEVTSLNEFIKQPIKNQMFKNNKFFELVWLNARASKEERVASLAPFYRQGYIYHNRACCGKLEAQLLGFPRSKMWDVMDAVAYIVELLELGERYFTPSDQSENDPESEYDELDYEDPIEGWRFA